jgi:uncharacterized phage protein (TIGR02220 family)
MAMEYARLYFDFFTSEKTQFLLDECGSKGVVCLQRLWVRAGQRNNDGLFNLTDPDFVFLEKVSENEFRLHNWLENNDHLSEKAKEMRTEKARRAGLASAEKRKQEATTSQLQVNNESTASQLNPTRGQLGSTNLTKHNLKEHNTKNIADENPKPDPKQQLAEQIINHFNKTTGRDNGKKRPITLTGKTKSQIMARIKEGYKLDDFKHVTEVCYYNWIDDKEFKGRIHPQVIFNNEMDKRLVWEKKDKSREGLTRD